MLSRGYLLFVGILLIVLAIGGYLAPGVLGFTATSTAIPTIMGITGLVALIVGFFSRSVNILRWFSGLIGIVYLAWGVVALFFRTGQPLFSLGPMTTMIVGIGALGIAVALAPAQWLQERQVYAHK